MIELSRLVRKAQKGDDKAYIELFSKYEDVIYRTAYLYVKNKEDALDIVQETAYRSFKSINTLKKTKFFKTWLIKITISCSIDILRKKENITYLNDECLNDIQQNNNDIDLSLSISQLLNCLDNNEKNVIILKYYHDYTFNIISQILDIPLGTVKTMLYRALKKLRIKGEDVNFFE